MQALVFLHGLGAWALLVFALVVAVWGVVGLVLGIRFFSWEPRT